MNDKSLLSVRKINKIYFPSAFSKQPQKVVSDLSFELQPGQAYGLIGPNGAGKSTTVKIIIDLVEPDQGEVYIFNQKNNQLKVKEKIGYMPENPSFYAYLSAWEFLVFIGQLFSLNKFQLEEKIWTVLKSVGLEKNAFERIKGFSKGMKQRLNLAQALINDPNLLILDEPLDGLDPLGRRDIKSMLVKFKERGKTILLSSHILSDVAEICDSIGIIDQGKLLVSGATADLIPQAKTLEEYFITTINSYRQI